jgi:signal transduction histidine kinase/ActR/RegA family two-component response regulator
MKKSERPAELRKRAEDRLKEKLDRSETKSHDSVEENARLVHELRVHQIELELQNEELQNARAELVVALARYSDLYDLAPMGYLTIAKDGGIQDANLTGARWLGMVRSRLVGARFGLFVSPEGRHVFNTFLASVFTSQSRQVCDLSICPEKSAPLWVHIEAVVSDDRRTCRAIMINTTERKRAEQASQESEARYHEAAEALAEEDRNKNHFLAVLSHELRNPLAPIANSLYILDRAVPGSEQSRHAQAVIGRQIGQLTRLVDDLLDLTRISHNKLTLHRQRLDLNRLVQSTLDDHGPQLEKSEVRVVYCPATGPVFIDGDGNRLAQIVGNLLQNAVKFTGPGGHARVSVSLDSEAKQAVVRVADTGVGMVPEMLAHAFQPFIQADATLDRSKGGLGLGLSLVKRLVELHGGTISAHSPGLGQGAEFVVRLPLALEENAANGTVRSRPLAPGGHRRVLIIEDNHDAADSLRDVLEFSGHEVEVAYDGFEGIAKAREHKFEVILCDIGLPGMDGFAVARALRADHAQKDVHLAALSGYALPEDVERAFAAGFDQHLAKPPELNELEQIFARLPSAGAALGSERESVSSDTPSP